MVRPSDDEKEALRQAAMAAVPILTRLKEEREDLDARIARFESVVSAYEEMLGGRRNRKTTSGEVEKPKRGQVAEQIDGILGLGGDYTEPELRKAIAERFGIEYHRATVYTALRRGLGKKYELKDNKRWKLKAA